MANNQVEIDVVLNAEQAEKGFDKLEEGSKAVGESFSSVGKAVSTLGGEANKALGGVGESLSGVVDGFSGLASAAKTTGASFTALAGPIGIAVMAVMELINAFREYGNEVDGTNIKVEAYAASATELTSIIEQLSDAQVTLNKETIKAFRIQSQNAQSLINQGELINQNSAEIKGQILELDKAIKQSQKNLKIAKGNLQVEIALRRNLNSLTQNRSSLVEKLSKLEAKADSLSLKGAKERKKLTEMVEGELKKSPEFIKKQRELEAKLINEANRNQLQATKDSVKSQIEIAKLGSKQKVRELKAIEDISAETRAKAEAGERARLQAEITAIEKSFADKRKAEAEKRRQKRQSDRAREAAMELAKARQLQSELKNLRSLELESMKLQGASALDLARERYNDELALAGENQNKILIATKRFENEKTRIQQAEQEQRLAHESQLAQQRQNFIHSTLEFDAQQIKDQTQRELALLDLRYKKEISLNEHTQTEITELQRRQSIERQKIQRQSIDAQIQQVGEFVNQYGSGLAEAAYASLLFGESFDKSVGNVLISLGKQAAVESLMETAKGTAALIVNPAAAANHFLAAGLLAGAAATAGLAGKAMGGNSGGGGSVAKASAGATSPTGTPQTATTPEREQADTSQMVFNINFGGAVIYDTQRAAEQALADRITNLQNTRRRGAPRGRAM